MSFKQLVLQEADKSLAKQLPDYNWVQQNTNWPGVELISNALTLYGRDKVQLSNYTNYLIEKLSNAVLTGGSVITHSDFTASINDIVSSIKYADEVFRLVAFSSMETCAAGRLRASVAIVLARKYEDNSSLIGSVVYKAIYDIKAKDAHYWHNSLGHLQRVQGWAIYKGLSDFKKNSDYLLSHIYHNNNTPALAYVDYSF